jgi:hypothetical protein
MTPPMPFANLVEACSFSLIVLAFFQLCIYQSGKKLQHKINKLFTSTKKTNKTPIKLK